MLVKLLYMAMLFPSLINAYELSICAIFQDDSKYIPEWIEFHQKQGVEHFYLYNNNSSDEWEKYLNKYIEKGVVDVVEWSLEHNSQGVWNLIQCSAYMDCINRIKDNDHWCAFLDTDEFLFCSDGTSIPEKLKDYESFPGVSVNWIMYGTSHVSSITGNQKLLDLLVMRAPLNFPSNTHVKTIVRCKEVAYCFNPHFFTFIDEKTSVTENLEPLYGCFTNGVSVEKFRINHYYTRDVDFFENIKIKRMQKWLGKVINQKEFLNDLNEVYDPILSGRG